MLQEERAAFRIVVADQGGGRASTRRGFGSRMVEALVTQLNGQLEYLDNAPGLRVVLTAPINWASKSGERA